MKKVALAIAMALAFGWVDGRAFAVDGPAMPSPEVIALPDGEAGIGFDDLQYSPGLKQILVPAGRTGNLALIDPATKAVTTIGGFSTKSKFAGGHGEGTTSSFEGDGLIFASDRGTKEVKVVDPKEKKIVASVALLGPPDYVRFVSGRHEVWVTEPGKKQIEILKVDTSRPNKLASVGAIAAPGGPEALVIDEKRGRAYTHTWKDETYAIDLEKRSIVATWKNGCDGSRGIAFDSERGFLFVGCAEGKQVVIDVTTGRTLSTLTAGSDVDSIGYSPKLHHLYVPGGESADFSILAVSAAGQLSFLGRVPTGKDAHTAAVDPATDNVFVGNPEHGQVLVIHDPFPASNF